MFRFDFGKAIQAVGVLLGYERARRMNYMRLLKLLYLADREYLLKTGRTITGDHAVAMKRGPVLRQVYDLIRGLSSRAGDWGRLVRTERYEVELVADPGRGELSKGEIQKLLDVSERYRDLDEWSLSDETHQLAEWKKNYLGEGKGGDILWEDVFVAAGKEEMIEGAKRDERARKLFEGVFGG